MGRTWFSGLELCRKWKDSEPGHQLQANGGCSSFGANWAYAPLASQMAKPETNYLQNRTVSADNLN